LLLHLSFTNAVLIRDDQIEQSALATVSKGFNYVMYPVGFYSQDGWKMTASLISAFPAKEIALTNLNLLFPSGGASGFFSSNIPLGLSYLTILMFYTPCSATVAVMHRETNWKLVFVHIGMALVIAYSLAIVVY
jgi:ferrous iron transport protein B